MFQALHSSAKYEANYIVDANIYSGELQLIYYLSTNRPDVVLLAPLVFSFILIKMRHFIFQTHLDIYSVAEVELPTTLLLPTHN